MSRVVITGIGAVTPLGKTFNKTWQALAAGKSGLTPITCFDSNLLPWKMAGTPDDFDPAPFLTTKEQRRVDPFVHYAVAAAVSAAEDARLTEEAGMRCLEAGGVIMGSSRGGVRSMESALSRCSDQGKRRVSPYLMPATTVGMAASYIAQKLGIKGHCMGISNACASGMNAVGEAFRLIRGGYGGPVLAGGSDAAVCRFCIEGYGAAGALSRVADPSASRPFHKDRDGFVLAEGACVLVLEGIGEAVRRNAPIYGEVIGYGTSADASHQTRPQSEGESRAMASALSDARVSPDAVDFVSAHATGTVLGDPAECRAIARALGKKALQVPVSALKSMTGHMLGASGPLEVAAAVMSLRGGIILPTVNLTAKDPLCSIDASPVTRKASLATGLCNSFGFGGVNAVVVVKRVDHSSP